MSGGKRLHATVFLVGVVERDLCGELHVFGLQNRPIRRILIDEMRAEAAGSERAMSLLLRALFFRLLVKLARAENDESVAHTQITSGEPRLSDLISWCEANVEREIDVAQLAARMFLSTAHFARLWKREIGVPPATYLRRLKLERARALLENSRQSVRHIARAVGFESAAHFSRSFRACYGVSPLQFRRDCARKSNRTRR